MPWSHVASPRSVLHTPSLLNTSRRALESCALKREAPLVAAALRQEYAWRVTAKFIQGCSVRDRFLRNTQNRLSGMR